jgi:hypothetical protein
VGAAWSQPFTDKYGWLREDSSSKKKSVWPLGHGPEKEKSAAAVKQRCARTKSS